MNANLTLNMGIRYEYNAPGIEVRGNKLASWDPARGRLVYPGEVSAGVLAPWGFVLSPAVGAVLMSASTVIVAINAQLLRRVRL